MRNDRREVLVTTLNGRRAAVPHGVAGAIHLAVPDRARRFGIGLCGSVFHFWWYYIAMALGGIGLIGWFWPREPLELEP